MEVTMSPQDISMLSAIGTLVLGTVIVPWVVAYVVKQSWTNTVKRLVAIGVSFAAATAGWYLVHSFPTRRSSDRKSVV